MGTRSTEHGLELRHRLVRCVQCGTRADGLLAVDADRCPRCGCDLLARPPRSYAEMEGLHEAMTELPPEMDAGVQARLDAAAARWVILLCAVAAVAMTMVVGAMLIAV
ncbi:MAG: hypothetical protein JNK53_04760 [Phycisphaerae bacterium]|nr:hypothetical protein [Phycisphaerae bacterium]